MSFYVSTATFFLLHCDEWDRVVALPRHKFVTGATLLHLVDSKQIYTVYEASACGSMPNFNENNIGFTKFCQENLKSHESMLQKYLSQGLLRGPLEAKFCFRYMYEEY